MSLNQEQRALIQLLCERGQSYADISGLLGISEVQVRERARATLEALGGRNPDSEVDLTDYLVGQADPIGRADAVRQMQSDPETLELAERLEHELLAIAPNAKLPKLPESRGGKTRAASAPVARSATKARTTPGSSKLPKLPRSAPRRSGTEEPAEANEDAGGGAFAGPGTRFSTRFGHARMIAAGITSTFILLVVILAVAGAFSSDDGTASETGISDSQRNVVGQQLGIPPEQVTQQDLDEFNAGRDVSPVPLQAVGGSGVAGQANFRTVNTTLAADVRLDGLDPKLAKNERYILWLQVTDAEAPAGFPVTTVEPDANGRVQETYPVPAPVAAAVAGSAQFVAVTKSDSKKLDGDIQQAAKDSVPFIPLSGDVLARGEIPLAPEQPTDG